MVEKHVDDWNSLFPPILDKLIENTLHLDPQQHYRG